MDRSASIYAGPGAYARTLATFFLLLAPVVLGLSLGLVIWRAWPALHDVGPVWWIGMAFGFFLAVALFLLALRSITKFIRCGTGHVMEAIRMLGPVLLLLFLTGVAAALASSKPEHEDDKRKVESQSTEPLGVVFGRSAAHDSVFVPFFPTEGKSKKCDPRQTDFGGAERMSGVGVEKGLKDLMASLAECSEANQRVRIDIRGFASSSEFQGCQGFAPGSQETTLSEYLNWRLAEARRQAVVETVREVSGRIDIDPKATEDRWAGPTEMRQQMQFSDRDSKGSYNRLKGALTRRAEVVILSKGTCEPL